MHWFYPNYYVYLIEFSYGVPHEMPIETRVNELISRVHCNLRALTHEMPHDLAYTHLLRLRIISIQTQRFAKEIRVRVIAEVLSCESV